MSKFTVKSFIFLSIFTSVAVNCDKIIKIQTFNSSVIDECENVSSILTQIIEKFFVKTEIRFDIVIIGNSSKINSVVDGIGRLNRGKFAGKIIKPGWNYMKTKLNPLERTDLYQSAVILVNSPKYFEQAILHPNFTYPKPFKVLFYCHNQSKKHLWRSSLSKRNNNFLRGLNYFFLINNGPTFDLLTFEKYKNSSNCQKPHGYTVNTYNKSTQKWKYTLRIYELYRNFRKCEIIYNDESIKNLPSFYHSKVHSRPQGFHADIIEMASKILNFTLVYHNGSEKIRPFIEFKELFHDDALPGEFHLMSTFYQRQYLFVIPPGKLFNNYEKLLWPFDEVIWIMLMMTFGFAFGVIFVLNFSSESAREVVYGEGVKTPSLNILYIFFGFGQLKVPRRSFSRFILILFIFFCLIFRTCYQSKQFEFMTSEMRKPTLNTIDDLLQRNFTIMYDESIENFLLLGYLAKEKNVRFRREEIKVEEFYETLMSQYNNASLKTAFYMDEIMVLNFTKMCQCKPTILTECYGLRLYGIGIGKNHIFLEIIDELIQRLITIGVMQHLVDLHTWILYRKDKLNDQSDPRVLTLDDLSFGFVLYLIACGISTIGIIDECENVSSILSQIMEGFYVKTQIRFDIVIIGNSSKINSVADGIGRLNRGKFAGKIIKPSFSVINARRRKRPFGLHRSAVILVNSTSNFERAILPPIYTLPKPFKVLLYCHGQNLHHLWRSSLSQRNNSFYRGLNYFFLINNSSTFELMTFKKYKNSSDCQKGLSYPVNTYNKITSKWKYTLRIYKLYADFAQCEIAYRDHSTKNLPSFYISKVHSQPQGYHVDLIKMASKILNFTLVYHNKSNSAQPFLKFFEVFNDIRSSEVYHITTNVHQRKYLFVIPPGKLFNNYEKLLWPFDEVIWIMLMITFGFAFGVIFVLNFTPESNREVVYGEGVKTPSLNILYIFFGFGQLKVPRRSFPRFILILFIFFCLIFRTCYQSKQFEFMTSEMRKPTPNSFKEIIRKNYTIVFEHELIMYHIFSQLKNEIKSRPRTETFQKFQQFFMKHHQNNSLKYAFLMDDNVLMNFTKICQYKPTVLPEYIGTKLIAIGMDKYHVFYDTIDDLIQRLIPTGIMQHLVDLHTWILYRKEKLSDKNDPRVLTLDDLSFGFVLYLIACGISIIGVKAESKIAKPSGSSRVIPKSKFTVVTPNFIRPGKSFNAYIRGFDLDETIHVKLILTTKNFKIENDVVLTKAIPSKAVKIDTSILPHESFQLTVTSGDFTQIKAVSLFTKQNLFFIQTNKAIFLPGDLIQFRIFSIDSETKAFNPTTSVSVKLSDARNNEIYKADNLTFVNGKYEGKFKISSSPILGTWMLQVQSIGEVASKELTVAEYVLPLFSASLSVPSKISLASSKFPITITAEYAFGEAVNGIAMVTFKRQDGSEPFTKNFSLSSSSNTFDIDIKNDLSITANQQTQLNIHMEIYDPISDTKFFDKKQITLFPYTYIVQYVGDKYIKTNVPFNYKFAVQNLDSSPAPAGTKINVEVSAKYSTHMSNSNNILTVDNEGFASGEIQTPASLILLTFRGFCDVCSNDYRARSDAQNIMKSINPTAFTLTLLTENPSHDDSEIFFRATVADKNIKNFNYFVTAKGVLLESSKVDFEFDDGILTPIQTGGFSINPDFTYAPQFRIYAYYLRESDWNIISTSLHVSLKKKLPNYLTLSMNDADASGNVGVRPNEEINLAIETNKYSTVSLYAVDQRVLQLNNHQNFTIDEVVQNLHGFNAYKSDYESDLNTEISQDAGLNFFTNIPSSLSRRPRPIRYSMERSVFHPSGDEKETSIRIRRNFLETFLWQDVAVQGSQNDDDNRGREVIQAKVPDSITTYVVFGVSMSKYDGMGLPETFPKATVFLPFFISMDLPYSVKRNELVIQTITIFNYLKKSQKVTVTIAKDAKFDIVDADKYGWTVSGANYVQQINCNDGSVRLTFAFRPKSIGFVNLKVIAKGPLAGDAIDKVLRVIHEGIPRSFSSSVLLAIDKASNAVDKSLKCTLPASAYSDYTEVSTSVVGDILGKALNNLDKLIVMPSGCGEQTLLDFVPDVVIYRYLKATNQLTDALKTKLTEFLLAGYQNELKYQRNDGGFSAFGEKDQSSSTWLTTYAAWSFYSARDYIAISPHVIQKAMNFIISQANVDGSFKEPGRVFTSKMQGATGNGIAMTAYVTIVLSSFVNDYTMVEPKRDAAVRYLVSKLNSVTDVYELGVIANALRASGSDQANAAFDKFYALKSESPTEIFWKMSTTNNGVYSLDIEITAYGLRLLVARNENYVNVIKVVKYLISKSNKFGGYSSTQDTVMALAALSDFASSYPLGQSNLNLELTPNVGSKLTAKVDSTNALTLQSFSLNDKTRELKIHPIGTGIAIVSLIYNYFEDPSKTVSSFNISAFMQVCRYISFVEICVSSLTGNSPNMAIMEIRLPSGFIYHEGWNLHLTPDVSKVESYEFNTVVIIYFNSISTNKNCFKVHVYKSTNIADVKPGSVLVNDYYDTSKSGSASFTVPISDLSRVCNRIVH